MAQVWDPKGGPNGTGAYVEQADPSAVAPNFSQQAPPPPGAPPPPQQGDVNGYSNATGSATDGSVKMGDNYGVNGDTTLGKVRPMGGAGAWGGYSGTVVDDGNGGVTYDAGLNGRQEAVDRARGLGAAAAAQQAYQIDYGQANQIGAMGQQDRGFQTDAMALAAQTANGQNLQSQALGQSMLTQGVQAQQAGAAGARGGSLAQAVAMRQQAGGQAAFMQQGNTQLQAQAANEMAQGRDQYMQDATGLRSSDAQAQGLDQQQSIQQMQQELQQRQLNQQGQMGYEAQGQAVNNAAADAALKADELGHNIDSAASLRSQQQASRQLAFGGAMASTGGALIAKGGDALGAPPPTTPPPLPAPTSGGINEDGSPRAGTGGGFDPDTGSDVRMKMHVRNLATAVMARRGMR